MTFNQLVPPWLKNKINIKELNDIIHNIIINTEVGIELTPKESTFYYISEGQIEITGVCIINSSGEDITYTPTTDRNNSINLSRCLKPDEMIILTYINKKPKRFCSMYEQVELEDEYRNALPANLI